MREKLWTICFIAYAILLIWLCATRMDLIRDALAFLTLAIVVASIVLILIAFIWKHGRRIYRVDGAEVSVTFLNGKSTRSLIPDLGINFI